MKNSCRGGIGQVRSRAEQLEQGQYHPSVHHLHLPPEVAGAPALWRFLRRWMVGWCMHSKYFRWLLHRRMSRAQSTTAVYSRGPIFFQVLQQPGKTATAFEYLQVPTTCFFQSHLKVWKSGAGWIKRTITGSRAILLNTFGSEDRPNKHLYASPSSILG